MKMVVTTNWRSNATIAACSLVCFVTVIWLRAAAAARNRRHWTILPTGGHAVLPATFGA
jgi:hypothetical protein